VIFAPTPPARRGHQHGFGLNPAAVLKDSLILGASSSYSCEVKLRDDKESNVEQRVLPLLGRQPRRQVRDGLHRNIARKHAAHFDPRPGRATMSQLIHTDLNLRLRCRQQYFELWTLSICCDDTCNGAQGPHTDRGRQQADLLDRDTFSMTTAKSTTTAPHFGTLAFRRRVLPSSRTTIPTRISNHIILRSQIVHREMPTECAKHVKVD
jgi:hypothetical protein